MVAGDNQRPKRQQGHSREPAAAARRRVRNLLWLAAYLATMAALAGLLVAVRARVVADLSRPEAQAQWKAWQEQEVRRQADPDTPVRRRPPRTAEPPALVLLRDSFPAVLGVTLLVASVLFAFLMVALRGAWSSAPHPGTGKSRPEE